MQEVISQLRNAYLTLPRKERISKLAQTWFLGRGKLPPGGMLYDNIQSRRRGAPYSDKSGSAAELNN